MSNPSVQAAVIAAVVAFTVGVITQVVAVYNQRLTHMLTRKRETEKYYNEAYQKFFAPVISDVFLFIDMVTTFRRSHDSSPEREIEVKDRALDLMEKSLIYASPRLLSSYHGIQSYAITDLSGHNPSRAELNLLYDVVREYAFVIQQSSIFSQSAEKEQLAPVYRRMILFLLHLNNHAYMASHSWMFDQDAYTAKNHREIVRILDELEQRRTSIFRQDRFKWIQLDKAVEGKTLEEETAIRHAGNRKISKEHDTVWKRLEDETEEKILELLISYPRDREFLRHQLVEGRNYHYAERTKSYEKDPIQ